MSSRVFFCVCALLVGVSPAPAVELLDTQDVIARHTFEKDGVLFLRVDGIEYELVTDPHSPLVSPLGDGSFHPMPHAEVAAALASLGSLTHRADLRVFLLPFPRRHVLKSSCHHETIVLSPGIREIPREHVWTTVVHEVGHALQHRFVPEGSKDWAEYLRLRGIDDPRFHDGAEHRDRPREIFAEDFRYLRGPALANTTGTIENPDLPLPDTVPGLTQWFRRAFRQPKTARLEDDPPRPRATPNPFRASANGRLEVRFARRGEPLSGAAVVHDLTGRRVRTLTDRREEGTTVVFSWDGRAADGRPVAGGVYFVHLSGLSDAARVQILR